MIIYLFMISMKMIQIFFFDVSGYKSKDSIVYSIAAASFTEFLQFQIDEDTLSKYSNETILAHCFYEITYYGFDDLDRKL